MKQRTFIVNRIIAVMLLTSVFTFAFVWSTSSASNQSSESAVAPASTAETKEPTSVYQPKRNAAEETSTTVLKTQKRGFPLINLQDGKRLETSFVGSKSATQSFDSAQALTMTDADLNLDGAPDLIVGYAGGSGGHLALYTGNPDALSARTPETFEAIKEGRFPAPFLPEARLIALPVAPDFIGAGDFNRDGYKDIVAAQRGANSLVLLAGSAKGNYKPQTIELPGGVTALMAENIDPADGQTDVAVALSDSNGAWLFVFDNQHNAFAEQPRKYPLPAEATSLAIGQLDNDAPMDILAAAGGRAVVIHGSYAEKNESPENQTAANARQVEILNAEADVAAVRVGHFVWDRENRPEIALLSSGGAIQILKRGNLDTRQYTEEEWETHLRAREEQDQIELMRRSADPTNRANYSIQKQSRQVASGWTEADSFQLSSGFNFDSASPVSVFTSARMTSFGVDDLIVSDAGSRKIKILVSNNDTLKSSGEAHSLSAKGGLAVIEFDAEETTAAVLPMRLSVMTRPGLVMLNKESAEISYAPAAPAATYTVTKTADTYDGFCDGDCSLREAIRAANLTVGVPDIVMVPAGTYTLTLGPADDSPGDPSAQGTGDLDIRQDLTITGAGQATTIIQAGTTAATGIDRVLHARQTSVGIPNISISGVTIRNGRCSTAGSVANSNGARCNTGGAGFLDSVDDIADVTISDTTFATNWNVATNAGTGQFYLNGAGLYVGRGDTVLTNVTFSNNETGATGSDHGGDGGAMLFGFGSSTNTNTVTLTNCTVSGNIARKIGSDTLGGLGGGFNGAYDQTTISGGTFTSNQADLDGGGIYNLTNTNLSNSLAVTSNSAKRDGGGIWSDPFTYDSVNATFSPGTDTFANITVRGNTADSDNTTNIAGDPRGAGGGIYHDRNNLNLTNVTIGGTTAGQPNTSYDGGGLGQRYRAQASTTNVSTITINGGSIVGNIANNDGGGIYHNASRTAGNNATLSVAPTTNITLTDNKAKNNGGGVFNAGGASATLRNMTLRSNQANSDNSGGGDGGALYQDTAASTTTFTGTLTVGGSGFANTAVNGGGIRNNAGTVTVPDSPIITFNTASGTGGGISNAGTLSALVTATITNNTATGNGGGIFNTGALGTISTPTLNSNSAANGGGIFTSSGILTVTNGTINSNTATAASAGGGILYAGSGASTVTGATVNNNIGGSGIYITANALDITNTTITGNAADGISKTGTGTGSELISGNTIFNNGSLGIDLSDNGVTANDAAGDADTGPNNLQNYPVINFVRRGDGIGNVTLNSTASRNFRINFFANTTCDASGFGEGEVSLGTQNVTTNASGTVTFTTAALAFGAREQITATATDLTTGDTSEFSACRQVNRLPTFGTAQTISRQQGTLTGNNGLIATVADLDQAANTLDVKVNGNTSATVNGVTVSNIQIAANGNVTADVVAICGATIGNATFTLRVTDTPGEFNEQTLTVNVTANTAPTVGTYANTTVNAGSNVTVTPSAAPTDNGSIASVTASASAGFTGTFATNTTTGAVTITNAAPAGTYTITVNTTDNCTLATTRTFTLTVNAIPTITAQSGVTRQQGSPLSNSPIATVADADQAANTLTVTIRAVGGTAPGTGTATNNGVTVSNIAVSATGVVTADIVAACGATNAPFTLRVTDANGAFSEATLNVTVTANTAPTVGTYANTTVNLGGSTTVTPTAAPADNGTFTATVASSAGFTGTLSVNQTTGVVTVTNAAPAGAYTITVTFTDGCTLAVSRTFTLTVNTPPTITSASGITRQQANGTSNSQIATVADPDQAVNTLTVTIRAVGGAAPGTGTATVNGVTVSNIAVSATGVVTADIVAAANATAASFTLRVTDSQGSFAETTLSVTVTPASYEADVFGRPNGDTFIDADDIQQIRNFSIGLNLPYQSNEFQRADCAPRSSSGDGFVDSDDIQQARRYSVGPDAKQTAAGLTSPLMNLLRLQTAQSFIEAVTGFSGLNAPEATPAFRINNQTSSAGQTITVPIRVDTAGNEAGYTFSLSYDSTVLTNPQVTIGTAGGDVLSNTMTAGQIGFSVTSFTGGTIAAGTNLLLVNVTFTVAPNAAAGTTTISFTDTPARRKASGTDPNTPIQQPTFMNGTVTITGPTAATVTIGGRILTRAGRGISGALLTLTSPSGQIRTATSTEFGYYQFEDVEVGETYILSVTGKWLTFSQPVQILDINEANDQINFIVDTDRRLRSFPLQKLP